MMDTTISREEAEELARAWQSFLDRTAEALDVPECTAPLPLQLINRRWPMSIAELSLADQRQLIVDVFAESGEVLLPQEILPPNLPEDRRGLIEIWDVVDANGALAYRLWLGSGDGMVFRADSTTIVGTVIQENLECDELGLEAAMMDAKKRVPETELNSSGLRFMGCLALARQS
jgi:hypothetical protein